MQEFSAFEYLCIDIANHFGLDKEIYADRIAWTIKNIHNLEDFTDQAETKPLYVKAVQAMRKVQRGESTGHLVGFDAVNSGAQIMSALTGCVEGAKATGLIDTGLRPDAYSAATVIMANILGCQFHVERSKIKKALMTVLYGSSRKPKELFGEGTPEYRAFYQMLQMLVPGAYSLLQTLLNSWNPNTLAHEWKLPDGFDVRVKVIVDEERRIQVDELGGASFTFQFKENKPEEKGLSNAANVIHSFDAYLLRSLIRRCSYKPAQIRKAKELLEYRLQHKDESLELDNKMVNYLKAQYVRSNMPDTRILSYLDSNNVFNLTVEHCEKLLKTVNLMLEHQPFDVITVHDDFKCHARYMNHLRKHYANILAEMSESNILDDVLTQLYGYPGTFPKLSNMSAMANHIRESDYAIC